MTKLYDIRDPIFGFIELDDWERDIINHSAFQRLRRIHQLGMTGMIYPGAMHTRFEHSLGVMHTATRMFDHIIKHCKDFLMAELGFDESGLKRDRILVRLSCLLHDIGHAPFSHSSEGLMGTDTKTGKTFKHENYSASIVTTVLQDVIENHPKNDNYNIKAQDIANFIDRDPSLKRSILWCDLLSGNLDADRADYLLRDSHHLGVTYGHYDLDRLISTMTVATDPETSSSVIAIEEGGEHAAEALLIARYMMFTQVYFQHTRRSYDFHTIEAIKSLLLRQHKDSGLAYGAVFPPPNTIADINRYLNWDDWLILGLIKQGEASEHGNILLERKHHRTAFETPEVPSKDDLLFATKVREALGDMIGFVDRATSSWYKFDSAEVPYLLRPGRVDQEMSALSNYSTVVKGLKAVERTRIYVPYGSRDKARQLVADIRPKKEVLK